MRIGFLEQSVRDLAAGNHTGDGELDQVLAFTKRLFPVDIKVTEREDPEIYGHLYFALEVEVGGSVDELIELNRRWHEEIAQTQPQAVGRFTLSVIPKDSA
jgi:hypothetical protein